MALKVPPRPVNGIGSALSVLRMHGVQEPVALIGVRGWFETGEPGNERQVYDDAIFLVAWNEVTGWNANTDPSVTRKGVAVLQPGVWTYKQGLHGISGPNPYTALRQAGNVRIIRDGETVIREDTPATRFWIDIHRGGYNTTSSLGCQTIHPDQWLQARAKIFAAMNTAGEKIIRYVLVDGRPSS